MPVEVPVAAEAALPSPAGFAGEDDDEDAAAFDDDGGVEEDADPVATEAGAAVLFVDCFCCFSAFGFGGLRRSRFFWTNLSWKALTRVADASPATSAT